MENNALKTVNLNELTPSKFAIDLIAESIAENLYQTGNNILQTAVYLNSLSNLAEATKDKIMELVVLEIEKYPKATAEVLGATISKFDSVKYDYSHIPEWIELEEKISALKKQQKEIEDREKKYYKGDLPIKSASSSYKIKLSN